MRYIDYENILTPEEIKSLGATIGMLSDFLTRVPVERDGGGREYVDMSMRAYDNGHLLEVFAILKRFYGRFSGTASVFDPLWRLLLKPVVPAKVEDLANMALSMEPFFRNLELLLTGRRREHTVYNSFFEPFREQKAPYSILPRGDNAMTRFFRTLKSVRNMVGHGHDDLPVESGRLMLVTGYILLINRFYAELTEQLIAPGEYVEMNDAEVAGDAGLRAWADEYMQQQRARRSAEARAALLGLFAGTLLEGSKVAATSLPALPVKPTLTYAPGTSYVMGASGTGVTSVLLRAVADGTPCANIAIPSPASMRASRFNADWLLTVLGGPDVPALSPRRLAALRLWLADAVTAGSVAIVFDTAAPPSPRLNVVITSLMGKMPGLMFVVGATPPPDGEEARYPVPEFRLLQMRPLTDAGRRSMTHIFGTLPFPGFDLGPLLEGRMAEMCEGLDLTRPRIFMAALDWLARHLGDTAVSRAAFLDSVRREAPEARSCDAVQDYMELRASVNAVADETRRLLYQGPGRDAAMACVRDAGLLDDPKATRDFLQTAAAMAAEGNENAELLSTLIAQVILADGADDDGDQQAPSPAINKLARLTTALPLEAPRAVNGDCSFRPSPRYIAERYVLNMMRLHTPESGGEALLRAAVNIASPDILDELFSPRWCAIVDDDRITRAASSVFSANPVELALRTADRLADLSLTGRTPANPVGVFAHALIRLNDAQRADLIGRLRATADRRRYTALPAPLAVNMTLLSFKAPTCPQLFDTATRMQLPKELWHGFLNRSDGNASAWPVMMQVARLGANMHITYMLAEPLRQLVENGAYAAPQFVRLVDELLDNRFAAPVVAEILDDVPLADLDPATAIRLYNPTLTDLTIRSAGADAGLGATLEVNDGPTVRKLVAPEPAKTPDGGRPRYSYRLYGRGDGLIRLSTEAFAGDAPVGKFAYVEGTGVIGRVAAVNRTDAADEYAHLTIALPDAPDEWPPYSTMFLSLGPNRFSKVVPWLAAFPGADRSMAVLRIDDPAAIAALREGPLDNLSVKALGRIACVQHVEIVPLGAEHTFVDIVPPRDAAPALPAEGYFTLHFAPEGNARQFAKVPYIELPQGQWRTPYERGPLMMVLAEHDGQLIAAYLGAPFARGTVLQHRDTGDAFAVTRSFAIASRSTIPQEILEKADKALEKYRKTADKPMQFKTLAMLRPLEGCSVPEKMRKPGFVVYGKLEPRWCNAVFEPAPPRRAKVKAVSYPCSWMPVKALRLRNRVIADIPYNAAFEAAAHLRLSGVPFTFTARYAGGRFVPDAMLDTLLADRLDGSRADEPFFVELLDADMQPIVAEFDNLAPLLTLAGAGGRLRPETVSMLRAATMRDPLLLPAAGPALRALGDHASWLAEMVRADLLTPEICATLPLDVTARPDGKGRIVRWIKPDGTKAPVAAETAKALLRNLPAK